MRAKSAAAAMLHSAIFVISQTLSCEMAHHHKLAAEWLLHLRKSPPAVTVSYPGGFCQVMQLAKRGSSPDSRTASATESGSVT